MAGLGGAGGGVSGAVRAGRAFVELFVQDNKVWRALDLLKGQFVKFGGLAVKAGASLGGLGTAVTAPLFGAAKAFESTGDALDKMAGRTGLSVEFLSELDFAANRSGSNIEEFERSIKAMQKAIEKGAGPAAEEAKGAIAELGLQLEDVRGKSPEEQFYTLANAIADVPDASRRAALAMKVFGVSGTGLLNLLADGSKGIGDLRKTARELGLVWSTADSKLAAEQNDAWFDVVSQLKKITFELGAAVSGSLTEFLNDSRATLAVVIAWVKENRQLIGTIGKVGAGLVATGALLVAVGKSVGLATAAFSLLGAIAAGAYAVITSPVAIGAAAGAGLFYLIAKSADDAQELKRGLGEVMEVATETFGGIFGAVVKGDLQLAADIIVKVMELAWASVRNKFEVTWAGIKFFAVDAWKEVTTGIQVLWTNLMFWLIKESARGLAKVATLAATIAGSIGADDLAEDIRGFAGEARRVEEMANETAKAVISKELNEAMDDRRLRKKAFVDEVDAADDKVAKLRAELAALNARGAAAVAKAEVDGTAGADALRGILAGALGGLDAVARTTGGSAGTFSAMQAGQLAVTSLSKQQLKAAQETAENTEKTAKAVFGLAKALRFG